MLLFFCILGNTLGMQGSLLLNDTNKVVVGGYPHKFSRRGNKKIHGMFGGSN